MNFTINQRADGSVEVLKRVRFLLFFKRWKVVYVAASAGEAWSWIGANGG